MIGDPFAQVATIRFIGISSKATSTKTVFAGVKI
jgi:hypothetical protein